MKPGERPAGMKGAEAVGGGQKRNVRGRSGAVLRPGGTVAAEVLVAGENGGRRK